MAHSANYLAATLSTSTDVDKSVLRQYLGSDVEVKLVLEEVRTIASYQDNVC